MRKIKVIAIAAVMFSITAYGQEPTTTQKEGLKGNVLTMEYSKYEYKENFGEPTEGELKEQSSMSFDEQGRSVAIRQGSHSYVMEYSTEDANTIVTVNDLNYEQKSIYTYDKNNIVIKHDYLERGTLVGRLISSYFGSYQGHIVYDGKIYNRQGVSTVEFRVAYKNGLVMIVDNKLSNRYDAHQEIKRYEPGVFTYDSNGNLTSIVFNKAGDPLFYISKYSYNAKGSLVKYVRGSAYNTNKLNDNDAHTLVTYGNYRYDEHGNWIYRTVGADRPRYIEKRQISYWTSSADMIKQKEAISSIQSSINERDAFNNYYAQYLRNKNFEAKLPMSEYDVTLAKKRGTDKMTARIYVSFVSKTEASFALDVYLPSNSSYKMDKLAKEWETNGVKRFNYEYKDGIITMNNEQYKIDLNTQLLVNLTRNIKFSRR